MACRTDPGRIFVAQRAGVRARLIGTGLAQETADRWLDAWAIETVTRDLPRDGRYWDAVFDWVMAERAGRRPGWM